MKKLAQILLLTTLTGCYVTDRGYKVDSEFSEEEKELIVEAAQLWNEATDAPQFYINGTFSQNDNDFDIVEDWRGGDRKVHALDSNSNAYKMLSRTRGDFSGTYSRWSESIAITRDRIRENAQNYEDTVFWVAVHEFGHVFFSWHLQAGIMMKEPDGNCIDMHTLETVCDLNHVTCGDYHVVCR